MSSKIFESAQRTFFLNKKGDLGDNTKDFVHLTAIRGPLEYWLPIDFKSIGNLELTSVRKLSDVVFNERIFDTTKCTKKYMGAIISAETTQPIKSHHSR